MCPWNNNYSNASADTTPAERRFVALIRAELGVEINEQAWRIFLRHNKRLAAAYFHRIVDDGGC